SRAAVVDRLASPHGPQAVAVHRKRRCPGRKALPDIVVRTRHNERVLEMTEPQVSFVRVVRTEIGVLRSEMRAERSGLRAEMNARFETVDARFNHLDRDVAALSKRVFGAD